MLLECVAARGQRGQGCATEINSRVGPRAVARQGIYADSWLLGVPAAEIIMFDNVVVVYKYIGDLMFYVTGSLDENELILYTVLQAFYESVTILLRCERALVEENKRWGQQQPWRGLGSCQGARFYPRAAYNA